jgi:hypothetical protein
MEVDTVWHVTDVAEKEERTKHSKVHHMRLLPSFTK